MMQRVVCLWFPDWPIQRIQREQPELEGRPVVLFADSRQRLVIVACSAELRRHGVQCGMPLAEGRALLGTSGKVVWKEHVAQDDRTALQQLAQRLQQFSPMTALMPVEPCDAVLIDISGCAHLFGGEDALAHAIWKEMLGEQLRAALCIADTAAAAWALARYGFRRMMIVPAGQQGCLLDDLPVAALRLTPACLTKLSAIDIESIGEVRKLPRASLPSRFGKDLLLRLDQAMGEAHEIVTPERLAEPIESVWTCEEPLQDLTYLETIWSGLVARLLDQLSLHRMGIREMEVLHRTEDRQEITLELRLHRPAYEIRYLTELLSLQCDRRPLPPGLVRVRAQVTLPGRQQPRQVTLFDEAADIVNRSLADLLDRLRSRLGETSVRRPVLVADPQPEFARSFLSLSEAPLVTATKCEASNVTDRALARCRPLRLFPEPREVQLLADRRMVWDGRRVAIIRIDQPERIETGWQREKEVRRDYYRLRLEGGVYLWVFRCDVTGHWYVHGTFD